MGRCAVQHTVSSCFVQGSLVTGSAVSCEARILHTSQGNTWFFSFQFPNKREYTGKTLGKILDVKIIV